MTDADHTGAGRPVNVDGYIALLQAIFYERPERPSQCRPAHSTIVAVSANRKHLVLERRAHDHWFDWYRAVPDDGTPLEPHEMRHSGRRYRLVRALDVYLHKSEASEWPEAIVRQQRADAAFFNALRKVTVTQSAWRSRHFRGGVK